LNAAIVLRRVAGHGDDGFRRGFATCRDLLHLWPSKWMKPHRHWVSLWG
jgi:hypothetical protein